MKEYNLFKNWKIQQYRDDSSTQTNLKIKYNSKSNKKSFGNLNGNKIHKPCKNRIDNLKEE
jgi:hypothetical protein